MLKAREVLRDCRHALNLLQVEEDPDTFRVLWVSATALCRAVGHVLHKVDGKRNRKLGSTVADAYRSWQADRSRHAVFWEFIENERNQVLKQYELGFLPGTVAVAVDGEVFQLGDTLFSPMSAGPYAWEDCRDVLAEAVEWWQVQLNQVEAMMVSA